MPFLKRYVFGDDYLEFHKFFPASSPGFKIAEFAKIVYVAGELLQYLHLTIFLDRRIKQIKKGTGQLESIP